MVQPSSPDVSVIIVNHNTGDLLAQCLRSLFEQTRKVRLEVIVVDNASSDDSYHIVQQGFPTARWIANEENVGFAKATNQGIRVSSGRHMLLLNPDTLVHDRAIERMVAFADDHARIGACGCKLMYPDGTILHSAHPFPTLLGAVHRYSGLFHRIPSLAHWLGLDWIDPQSDRARPVQWCSGACLLVPRECVNDVGFLDESFFLYAEDVDWCRRMWKSTRPVFYLGSARVVHVEGASQSRVCTRRLRVFRGELQYLRKWRGSTYTRAYQATAWICSLHRYFRLRWRRRSTPSQAEYLADQISFCRAILTGRLEAER